MKIENNKQEAVGDVSELSDLLCPLASICSPMVFASKDWSEEKVDSWIYGVAVGWEDESLAELKQKFNWSDEIIDRLKTLHNNFKNLWA